MVDLIPHDLTAISSGLLFTLIMTFAFYGYGNFISSKIGCLKNTAMDTNAGLKMLLGFSAYLWLSGFVEFFQIGGKALYFYFLLLGIALGAQQNLSNISRKLISLTKFIANYRYLLLAIIILATVTFLLINISVYQFNGGDDYQGYLIFSKRLITEGFQGIDPFSTRLVEQGFGSGNSLNALFLSSELPSHLHLGEGGTGTLLLVFVLLSQCLNGGAGKVQILLSLLVAYALVVFSPIVNISPLISGCAMMLGILILTSSAPHKEQSYIFALVVGFFLASFLSLKGTFLVPAFVTSATFYLSKFILLKKRWVIAEAILTFASFAFFLMPWLISNFQYHGTAFYPLLGKGFSTSGSFGLVGYKQFINSISELLPLFGLLITAYILLISQKIEDYLRIFSTTLLLTVITVSATLAMTPGGFFRYSYVLVATPAAFLLSEFLSLKKYTYPQSIKFFGIRINKYVLYFAVFTAVVLMIHQTKRNTRIFLEHGLFVSNQALPLDVNQIHYTGSQESIPEGASLLSITSQPYLYNFQRNKIYVMDYPGNAGPKPGIPYKDSYLELASYLRSNNIRYIAHSYLNAEGLEDDPDYKIAMNSEDVWMKNLFSRNNLVNKQLLSFKDSFSIIFDDGQIRVFDLCNNSIDDASICNQLNVQ